MMQAEGYDVVLQCEIDAFPAPAINWIKEGKKLANDDKHLVAHFSKGVTHTLTTLKVSD